ncbi:carnitine O-acetyltransferase isoform X2 [Cephus cinctus]|nr:carnitine O-acetyltransferase isoform X2 [Cephus cinctus]
MPLISWIVKKTPTMMHRSMIAMPSRSRQLMFTGLRSSPGYAQQSSSITSLNLNMKPLPKQPVPELKKTMERYLKSLKPLLTESEYRNSEKLANDFIKDDGPGIMLHKKLLERFEKTENWMSEWWLQKAYLGYRAPVIVNSSPGTVGPPQEFSSQREMQVFAARVIRAICEYDRMVKSQSMKQEAVRDIPLDMQPYAMILGTHRQPNDGCDNLLHTDNARHAIILSNNHFFKLDLYDNVGEPIHERKLAAAIKDILDRSCTPAKPVGVLTGNCRDTWVQDYSLLKDLGQNHTIFNVIENSLFILCLDKPVAKECFKEKNNASVRAVQSMTGLSMSTNSGNRWHDKTVQYIVSSDGFVGMEYEHSPCEGVPIAVLHDHVLRYIDSKGNCLISDDSKDFSRAELLKFELNDNLEVAMEKAARRVEGISQDIDMECFTFMDFGADTIKKLKLSPDSFIQIAMQVAFYRTHKRPPAHYESAALRRFKNARTECIRSTSVESVDFAKVMTSSNANINKLKEAMLCAINAHKNLAGQAATGEGVDRLLFGMKMIAETEKLEIPELYRDRGYTRSTYFDLTSSQVPYKTASFMCYGPVVPDGYGCCYNPRPNDILIACSSFRSSSETCTKSFANELQKALRDMKKIAES